MDCITCISGIPFKKIQKNVAQSGCLSKKIDIISKQNFFWVCLFWFSESQEEHKVLEQKVKVPWCHLWLGFLGRHRLGVSDGWKLHLTRGIWGYGDIVSY